MAVSKILLEAGLLLSEKWRPILDKMIAGCVPQKNMKLVTELISNEKYHYVELKHKSSVLNKFWELGEEIKQCNLIEITYGKQIASKEIVKRVVQPVALIFSEYYFYLNAFIIEAEVYGKGILMWLLSQGSTIEVLRPQSVRNEMKKVLLEMLNKY